MRNNATAQGGAWLPKDDANPVRDACAMKRSRRPSGARFPLRGELSCDAPRCPLQGVMRNAAGTLFYANDRARFATLYFPVVMDNQKRSPGSTVSTPGYSIAGLMMMHAQKFRQLDYGNTFSSLRISIKVT